MTQLLTYLHTSWSRVLLENLTCSQLANNFLTLYGTRRFITAFTTARHLSLSRARSIQSTTHCTSKDPPFLPSTPRSSRWSLSLRFFQRNSVYTSPVPNKDLIDTRIVLCCILEVFRHNIGPLGPVWRHTRQTETLSVTVNCHAVTPGPFIHSSKMCMWSVVH